MSLRSADAYQYASFRSTLAESDCNAVLSNGDNAYTVLPVLIEDGGDKLYVEIEYRFYDPQKLPNFVRFELTAAERDRREAAKLAAEAAEKAKKLPGKNWLETRRAVETINRQGLVDRYADQKGASQADIAQGEAHYAREGAERESARQKHARSRI